MDIALGIDAGITRKNLAVRASQSGNTTMRGQSHTLAHPPSSHNIREATRRSSGDQRSRHEGDCAALNVFASLSELMLDLLTISLAPGVPALLKNIPKKYNIIVALHSHKTPMGIVTPKFYGWQWQW